MSAIRLLVLGAVRQHGRAHGYMIRNDLEFWGAHEWSNAKPGSIYHALKQLAKQGLLTAHETAPSTAGGPPRTEYEMTEAGHAEFLRLLRHALTSIDEKPDVLTSAVGFVVDLPRAEAVALLRERVASLEQWRAEVGEHWTVEGGQEEMGHIGEIMGLWVHNSDSGAQWARGLIERLEGGAYVMAGEGEREVQVLPEGTPNPYAEAPHGGPARDGGHQIEIVPPGPGTAPVRVLRDGVELAYSARPLLLRETGYPDRCYLPPEDVHTELLEPTATTTHCPFKGDARYWSARGDGARGSGRDVAPVDIAWSYPEPRTPVAPIRDHLCFYEVEDGVRVERGTG